jgi:2-polyprenyl-3-methyl-5-hydroxy-6-metoxy-1,4-benzoquinol methylase
VLHRHPTWIDFVTEVWGYAYEHDGKVYNVIDHPDLIDIPAMHEWDRLELVLPRLPFTNGRALDIGTHWGFWCQQLERVGFECVGLELVTRNAYFAERIRAANGCRYQILTTSFFDHAPRDYDLIIALYIFHHLTKTEALYDQLVSKLRSLDVRAMVFGSHNHDQPAMQTAYKNFTPDEWIEFLLENSCLTRATHLGTEAGRREIYLLEA